MSIQRLFYILPLRIRSLLHRNSVEAELDEELRYHLERLVEENISKGMTPKDARYAALASMHGVEQQKETCRDARRVSLIQDFFGDLRFAARILLKSPSFTLIAILSLALGIGANTAIFQLLNAIRLRSLPVKAPHELVEVRMANMDGARGGFARSPSVTNLIWEQIRDRQEAFSGIFAWGTEDVNLARGGEVRMARMLYVSGDFFRTLDVQPVAGRLISDQDDRRDCGTPGLILSHEFWQREYGGDENVIGRKLILSDQSFEIIGVTPASFFGMEVGRSFDIALPICAIKLVRGNTNFLDSGIIWWLGVTGRLKPNWSLEQAAAHLESISPGIFESSLPASYPSVSVKGYLESSLIAVQGGSGVSALRERYEPSLWLLLAIAGLVLLIACVNLANLLLARASARQREIAVRQALGASRWRVVRQLIVESLLLAMMGAALGGVLARSLSQFLVSCLSHGTDLVFLDLSIDWRVLGFATCLAVATCMLFGLTPALRVTKLEPAAVMKTGSRGVTPDRERFSLRRALVVAQVALTLVLVAGALLFTRSLENLMTVDAGFRQEGVLIAQVTFRQLNLDQRGRQSFKDELLERVRSMPGVESAALTHMTPLRGWGGGNAWMDGTSQGDAQHTSLSRIGPEYFKTLAIPFLAGRDFDTKDRVGSPKVAIVNEAFTRQFLNGADAIGRRLWVAAGPGDPDTSYEIVGMVGNTKYQDLREEFVPIVYYAAAQDAGAGPGAQLLIRSGRPQAEIAAALKETLNAINPAITVSFEGFKPLVEHTILRERLMATVSSFFGLLALLLACIGLYGILSFGVVGRTNEIGIRMALGARRRQVFWLILREAVLLVVAGLAVGLPITLALTRLAGTVLYGLTPADPISLLLAAALMLAVSLIAGYLPSRRATGVDPMVALRCD